MRASNSGAAIGLPNMKKKNIDYALAEAQDQYDYGHSGKNGKQSNGLSMPSLGRHQNNS